MHLQNHLQESIIHARLSGISFELGRLDNSFEREERRETAIRTAANFI